jgi:hypothetical protein
MSTLLNAQLADWLAERLGDVSELRLSNLAYPRGAGQSHETILFDAGWRAERVTPKAMPCASSRLGISCTRMIYSANNTG